MPPNLVLTLSSGFSAQQLRPFCTSFNKTKHKNSKLVVFANYSRFIVTHGQPLTPETKQFLTGQADQVVPFRCMTLRMRRPSCLFWPLAKATFSHLSPHSQRALARKVISLVFLRFHLYLEYLETLPIKPKWVFLTDSRDVIFQDDPFSRLEAPGLYCVIELPGNRIGNCPTNARMLVDCFGKAALAELRDCDVSCSGTVIGDYQSIRAYLLGMVEYTMKLERMRMASGNDQGLHNYLVHKRLVPGIKFINNANGPIGTFGLVPASEIRRSTDHLVIQPDGRPYAVLHQHDRHRFIVESHPAYHT